MMSFALSASAVGESQPSASAERSHQMGYPDSDVLTPIADDASAAERVQGLALLRQFLKADGSIWLELAMLYPEIEPFALSVSSDAFVLDREGAFSAKAEALFRVPTKRANGTPDMASMALPVAVEGSVLDGGSLFVRSLRLLPRAG
ncbi:MAG: hypothetical protein ACT6XY_06655 [Phreatobacter sp.]|jgi:hypothetical protein|uniref:hypothetical protein n=1 Tax=Phreatobacter sp. TaxID=1966341 RepID=UPI0040355CE5